MHRLIDAFQRKVNLSDGQSHSSSSCDGEGSITATNINRPVPIKTKDYEEETTASEIIDILGMLDTGEATLEYTEDIVHIRQTETWDCG